MFQLVNPTAMDPVGIFMLKSVIVIFDSLEETAESFKWEAMSMKNSDAVIDAINNQIHPVVLAAQFSGDLPCVHAMVAISERTFKNEKFLSCKNSYRDDPDIPGTFHHNFGFRTELDHILQTKYLIWKNIRLET